MFQFGDHYFATHLFSICMTGADFPRSPFSNRGFAQIEFEIPDCRLLGAFAFFLFLPVYSCKLHSPPLGAV